MTRPTNYQRNRRRPQYEEQYEPHGFRVDTSELFSAGQILRWVGSLLVISAIAAISYNNLVSNITSVEKTANEVQALTDRQEARIRQLEAQNETSSIRSTARIENLEKRLDMIVVSVDKTSDSIKELSGQVRDLGNMVAIIATKTEADMQENDSDNQKHSTSRRTD